MTIIVTMAMTMTMTMTTTMTIAIAIPSPSPSPSPSLTPSPFPSPTPTPFSAQELSSRYGGYREIRGDGNCFYRAYLLSIFEQIALRFEESSALLTKFRDLIQGSKAHLVEMGFPEFAVDDFWESFVEQIQVL